MIPNNYCKLFEKINQLHFYILSLNLTKPQTKYLLNLISAPIYFEGKKNLSNLNRNLLNTTNRSNLNGLLTLSPWMKRI